MAELGHLRVVEVSQLCKARLSYFNLRRTGSKSSVKLGLDIFCDLELGVVFRKARF